MFFFLAENIHNTHIENLTEKRREFEFESNQIERQQKSIQSNEAIQFKRKKRAIGCGSIVAIAVAAVAAATAATVERKRKREN